MPSKVVNVRGTGQLTLPAEVRRQLGIESGDVLAVEVAGDAIVLRPKKLVDASQAYFWTKRWQRGERAAQRDIEKGRVRRFRSVDQLIANLKR